MRNHICRKLILALVLVFTGMLFAHAVSTSWFQIKIQDFQYITKDGMKINGTMYIPKDASSTTPAPAVITCSGGNNEYIMHEAVNTELARNGYVVVTFNPYKHGTSDIAATDTMGADSILTSTAELSFVDSSRIGMEGHTLGGSYLCQAAAVHPELVRSLICGDFINLNGSGEIMTGDKDFHCTWIFAKYGEYTINPGKDLESPMLQAIFSLEGPVENGITYKNQQNSYTKTAYLANTTNFGYHFSFEVIDRIVDTFGRTMGTTAVRPLPQIWPAAMLGKAISLFGLFYLLFAVLSALLHTSRINSNFPESDASLEKGSFFSVSLLWLSPILGAAAYIPLYVLGKKILEPTMLFPQSDSNGLAIWAAFISCLCLLFIRLLDRRVQPAVALSVLLNERFGGILKAFLQAACVFACCYACNLTVKWLFGTNISLFCTNFSTFNPRKALAACSYFPVFMIYFFCTGMFQIKYLYFKTGHLNPLFNCVFFNTAGFAALLLLNFSSFPLTGNAMFHWGRFAFAPILYMLPVLPVFGIVTHWCYVRTGKIYLSTFVNTFLFTWLFIATNAMYLV